MQNILKKILVLSLTVILMLSSISMALPSAHAGEIPGARGSYAGAVNTDGLNTVASQ